MTEAGAEKPEVSPFLVSVAVSQLPLGTLPDHVQAPSGLVVVVPTAVLPWAGCDGLVKSSIVQPAHGGLVTPDAPDVAAPVITGGARR